MLKKHAVRFIHQGQSRTYILHDVGTADAICTALDMLEEDVPAIANAMGLAVVAKDWESGGAALADEGIGPLIDTTKPLAQAATDLLKAAA